MTLNLSRCSCRDFPVLTLSSTLEPRKYGKNRICLKAIHMSKSSHPGLFKGLSALVLFSPLSQPDSVIYATIEFHQNLDHSFILNFITIQYM